MGIDTRFLYILSCLADHLFDLIYFFPNRLHMHLIFFFFFCFYQTPPSPEFGILQNFYSNW